MDKKIVLKNDLTTECRHKVFMYGLLQAKVIGMNTRADKKTDKPDEGDKPKSRSGAPETPVQGGNTFNIYAVDPKEDEREDGQR